MADVIYLDNEDEITGVIARLRTADAGGAALVMPPGSRLGTSRINFKLLAREADQRRLNLVVVSDEPSVRALAVSAGLPAYDGLPAGEAALARFRTQDEQVAQRAAGAPPAASTPGRTEARDAPPAAPNTPDRRAAQPTRVMSFDRAAVSVAPVEAGSAEASATRDTLKRRPASRWRLTTLLALLLVVLFAGGGVYAAYLYLPTATVTLAPRSEPFGPLEINVTADPSVAVPDAAAGIVPAERLALLLHVSDEFAATGVEQIRTPATGVVEFRSENTLFAVPVPVGTRVATADGFEFETTAGVSVPRASFETGPTTVEAPVEAVTAGPRGNVDEGAISQLPADLAAALISVTNPQPTSGGQRIEQPLVTQEDYDMALAQLTVELAGQLEHRLADPATTPLGLTLYPASVRTDEPQPTPPAIDVVGTVTADFTLGLDAGASVLAVNEELVDQVAADQLRAALPDGESIVGDAIESTHTEGSAFGAIIFYRATASALTYQLPDQAAIVASIAGKPTSEARAILEQYGSADITIWPDVVDRVPDQTARINLTVVPPENP